jgi:hypothetical protein
VRLRLVAPFVALVLAFMPHRSARAAPRFVERPTTLPRLVFAGNVGLGVAHDRFRGGPAPIGDVVGAGMNLEVALGVSDRVELGLRTGVRFGADGRRVQADNYARTLWTETYGVGTDVVANPEMRVRWAVYRAKVVEVALDWRLFLPVEQAPVPSRAGIMFGVPLAFHLGSICRIDTGVYLPVIFTSPTVYRGLTIPGYFWFQPSERLWLGPMIATRFLNPGPGPYDAQLLVGLGVGYQVSGAVDLKWQLFVPDVTRGRSDTFGAGFGAEFRLGE